MENKQLLSFYYESTMTRGPPLSTQYSSISLTSLDTRLHPNTQAGGCRLASLAVPSFTCPDLDAVLRLLPGSGPDEMGEQEPCGSQPLYAHRIVEYVYTVYI
jgi:hypothetical protein